MKVLRVLALCCVILALPLQGFAAVSQLLCHAVASPHAVAVSAHDHEATHAHHTAPTHEALQGMAHDAVHSAAAQHDASDTGASIAHQCSTCAQCAAGHAMAAPAQRMLACIPSGPTLVSTLTPLLSGVSPQPLERPPRLFLA